MPSRKPNVANHSGAHYLRSAAVAARLVRSAAPGSGQLVLDLGAGTGAITTHLARTGATVLAVERDDSQVRTLRARFADRPQVRVVQEDIRTMRLPHRPYLVVASVPFAITTAVLRRLLDEPSRLTGADLIVEWGLAKRLTAARPRDLASAWWAVRHELRLQARVPAAAFTPRPAVDAAHLRIRPRQGLDWLARGRLRGLLEAAYAEPNTAVGKLLRRGGVPGYGLARLGLAARTRAGDLTAEQWYRLLT